MDQDGPDPNFSAIAAISGDRAVVTVTGEVDMATAEEMFDSGVTYDAAHVTLDLRAVTFFDSAAIHALLRLADHYDAVVLRVLPSPQVRRVLEISGLAGQPWLTGSG